MAHLQGRYAHYAPVRPQIEMHAVSVSPLTGAFSCGILKALSEAFSHGGFRYEEKYQTTRHR
jgi:hypothetical protein